MNKAKVVAISGVSGSGKTSVIRSLSKKFSCPFLLFDDHTDENTYPKDMKRWHHNGADASNIKTPKLIDALHQLISDSNSDYVFIEEPFGRSRDSISSLIDYVILLDMPMEICLSRVIMRNINHPNSDSLNAIAQYLSMYEDHFREIYIESTHQIREDCDLIIQQVDSVESITCLIGHWLKNTAN
ncbi:hypothetical protein tinsulaeT_06690 [Thalassotalea insulae]|uniref:AAA+ ATPase domain-containing protein n=1 Tax=Thalassotalea insulae TaxID=2056778 RepID=A0ABQ6GPU4_9GAMM|nr:AAA family ATPase [Thalassotalea insulae]GLX77329.1 hypothetical protein tinsulaeT_06690 [Thalassotalea insulae]